MSELQKVNMLTKAKLNALDTTQHPNEFFATIDEGDDGTLDAKVDQALADAQSAKEIAQNALEQVVQGTGTQVKVNGTVVEVFDADTKADLSYVDQKVAALIGAAPDTLDTLEEVATAIKENEDVVTALNNAIGSKANQTALNALADTVGTIEENVTILQEDAITLMPTRDGTAIPANADLNTVEYLKVGTYYCTSSTTAESLANCPTTVAFYMRVYAPITKTKDDETTAAWRYRLREIVTYSGAHYWQAVNSSGTAGTFSYKAWKEGFTTAGGTLTGSLYINKSSVWNQFIIATPNGNRRLVEADEHRLRFDVRNGTSTTDRRYLDITAMSTTTDPNGGLEMWQVIDNTYQAYRPVWENTQQEITATKTLTSGVAMNIKNKSTAIATPPSSTNFQLFDFLDKDNRRIGVMGSRIDPTGSYGVYLQAGNEGSIGVLSNGTTAWAWAPNPATTDNSNAIATTSFVKNVLTPNNQVSYGSYYDSYDTVQEYYNSGYTWYRIWRSGWVECGGTVTSSAGTGTITFPSVGFIQARYYRLIISPLGIASNATYEPGFTTKNTTSFSYRASVTATGTDNAFDWYAVGPGYKVK